MTRRLSRADRGICLFSVWISIVRGGVEPTAGDVSDRYASVTTPDYLSSRDGETRTRCLVVPSHAGHHIPFIPVVFVLRPQSERPDSNWRSRGPRPRGVAALLRSVVLQVARRGVAPLPPA